MQPRTDYVIFENKGLLDLTALRTFGVSVKLGSNPIGFFGTGLKYALAVLARLGAEVTIIVGMDVHTFSSVKRPIRGQDFSLITMDGVELAFTTELGKTWQPWKAYRKLHCNAVDESGQTYLTDFMPEPEADVTRIVVAHPDFTEVYRERGKYILQTKPIHTAANAEIHPGESTGIFYRGVRFKELQKPSMFTYNILRTCVLTEDRTLQYDFQAEEAIKETLLQMPDMAHCKAILLAPEAQYEHDLNFTSAVAVEPGQSFLDAAAELNRNAGENVNRSAVALYRQIMRSQASAVEESIALNDVMQAQLKRAKQFLLLLGYEIDLYPVIVLDSLGENILGLAEHGRIYVARQAFDQGTKMVASTLMEEFIHLHHHYTDCSRGLQTFLFDRILSLGEQTLLKEPL